jgi:galactitol-specific phosphotransferase system IIB component
MEKMGYTQMGNGFYKEIGNYKITIFPTQSTEVIRRVVLNGAVIDIKKMAKNEIENDDLFKQILVQSVHVHKEIPETPKKQTIVLNDQVVRPPAALEEQVKHKLGEEAHFRVGTFIQQTTEADLFKNVTLKDKGE